MKDYHINIFYSEKEKSYIADIPDLTNCSATGRTAAEALANVEQTKERWLETASSDDTPIPEPRYRPDRYNSSTASRIDQQLAATSVSADKPSYAEDLKYIKDKIAQHQCILFLGSAIHVPPPPELSKYSYPSNLAPPVGSQLSKYLAEKSKYPAQDWWNLQRVAQHFESKTKSRFRLVEEIKNVVQVGKEPSPILRLLADLEFPIVITTNYDHLYERALDLKAEEERAAGKPVSTYTVSVYNPNITSKSKTIDCQRTPEPKNPYILKIHGDIDKPESIVLTDEDYIQFVLRMSDKHPFYPFGNNVLAHLMKWSTLFVGYSLIDYNLRLLFKILRWKLDAAQIPPTYSVDKKPDDLIRDVWESQRRYISFIILNLWDCIPQLHADIRKDPRP